MADKEEEWSEVTVDVNGNVWAGDELVVFEGSGDIKSVGSPPSGITKGEIATVDRSGNYSFSQEGYMPETGGFGTGSMPGAGGDIETALSIWDKLKDVSWGDAFKHIGKSLLRAAPSLIGLWSAMKSDDTQEDILQSQLGASADMLAAWKQDREDTKAVRTTLYDALDNRMKQGAPPALMPGKVAYANPYQNVVKIGRGAEGSGSPESGPGATLRDSIRSEFTDRHPNAPPQQFIQQHPDRFARPVGPSTWENQGGLPPQPEDQSMRPDRGGPRGGIDQWFQDADTANASLAVGQSDRIGTEHPDSYNRDFHKVKNPVGGSHPSLDVMESQGRHEGNPSLYDAQAQIAEAMRTRERKPLPDPTPEQWQRLLGNPQLMEIYKTKGILI
tara:strand:+ start:1020 stop:2180 length:1161 start_codon:yes stop_codon:yes gene_type:complete